MIKGTLIAALIATAGFAAPASAAILVGGIGSTETIPDNFSFKGNLASDFSLVSQSNDLLSINLTSPARLTFYALGSESGLENTFSFGPVTSTEQNFSYDASRVIGSLDVASAVSLGGLVFTSNGGVPAVPGMSNFGIFLPNGFNGASFDTNWLVIGYDDGGSSDNDFDDFVVGIQVSPIPEPHIWALMIAGFGLVGMQLRRHRNRSPSVAC